SLRFDGKLPDGIRMMNPYSDSSILKISSQFYCKYYDDNRPRKIILGINPGRLGAGATGIPFTDTKRLLEVCGISAGPLHTHEPSSVFIYDVVAAYGGAKQFFGDFYINSICPLGFVSSQGGGREVNYNYYDSKALTEAVLPFIVSSIREQLKWPVTSDTCYVLGRGKNATFLKRLNDEYHFFKRIVELEHPRYVMQYKSREKDVFVNQYLEALSPK
ncbi:MAG: DUF4918 family protein, partial [Flavobacteriales bacterium]|nr:DUF4918 family protein [Flavobacteriales bacterium]